MQRTFFASLLASVLLLVHLAPLPVAADCCNSSGGRCGDGTAPTPCCGYQSCNIFCCNCGGGCRHSLSVLDFGALHVDRGNEAVQCRSQFGAADANHDGMMSFAEWVVHSMPASEIEPLATRWLKFDVEGKGFLTEDEAFERTAA